MYILFLREPILFIRVSARILALQLIHQLARHIQIIRITDQLVPSHSMRLHQLAMVSLVIRCALQLCYKRLHAVSELPAMCGIGCRRPLRELSVRNKQHASRLLTKTLTPSGFSDHVCHVK